MRPCRESPFDSKPRPSAHPTQRRHPLPLATPNIISRSLSPELGVGREPVPRACPQGRSLRSLSLRDSSRSPRSLRLRVKAIPGACPHGWRHPSRSRGRSGACPRSLSPRFPVPKIPSEPVPRDGAIRAVPKLTNLSLPALPTSIPKSPPPSGACPLGVRPLGSSSRISRSGRAGSIRSNASPTGASRPNPDFHAASGGMGPRLAACCRGPGKVGERPT